MIRHALAPIFAPAADALHLPRTISNSSPAVAITFDDGPHPEGTPTILEILARHDARATFFMVGEQVARRPELARRVIEEGHGIALHGHRHRLQLRLSESELVEDYARGIRAIEDATGTTPTRHRPPYGIYSASGLAAARQKQLQPLLWSKWGKDWRKFTTPTRIARRIANDLKSGDVILLHDADFYGAKGSHERTAKALDPIISVLEARKVGTVLAV